MILHAIHTITTLFVIGGRQTVDSDYTYNAVFKIQVYLQVSFIHQQITGYYQTRQVYNSDHCSHSTPSKYIVCSIGEGTWYH